jgi:hypothetical protein
MISEIKLKVLSMSKQPEWCYVTIAPSGPSEYQHKENNPIPMVFPHIENHFI